MLIISTKHHSHTIGEASDIEDSSVHSLPENYIRATLGSFLHQVNLTLCHLCNPMKAPINLEAVQGVPFGCLSTALSSMSSGIGKAMRVL